MSGAPTAISATPSASTAAASETASPAPSSLSRDDGWRADIDTLLEARERLHPDPWHDLPRATWVAAADAVKARIPTMTDDQALVELVRLTVMPGLGGREGHTGIFPGAGTHEFPILLWQFSDGLVITAARAPYEDLVGSRIETIAGRPVADVLALVEPLTPRDNPSNLLAYAPLYLRMSEVLSGLGVQDRVGPATFGIVDPSGAERDVEIAPIAAEDDIAWHGGDPLRLRSTDALWLRDVAKPLWWTYLADSKTLYVQYNAVEGGIDSVADEILARAKQPGVDRVVVDLRNNGGGDNTTYRHLLAVLQDPAIDRPGQLDVLIGRLTFSAAANFATEVEHDDGRDRSSARTWAAARTCTATRGGSTCPTAVSRSTWRPATGRRARADDPRITIEPDLAIPLSSEDYLAGIDPVLAAVTAGTPVGDVGGGYPRPVTDTPGPRSSRGGTVVTADGSRLADVAIRGGRIDGRRAGSRRPRAHRPARRSTRPGCSCCRGRSTSTRTPASRPTPSPTGSSRIRWRPRSVARRRSCRSTTRGPGRRRRPSGRC